MVNAEEIHARNILNKLQENYPNIRTYLGEANYKKYNKRAYIVRNQRMVMGCTYLLMFTDVEHPSRSQTFIERFVEEELTTAIAYQYLPINGIQNGEVTHEEQTESISGLSPEGFECD